MCKSNFWGYIWGYYCFIKIYLYINTIYYVYNMIPLSSTTYVIYFGAIFKNVAPKYIFPSATPLDHSLEPFSRSHKKSPTTTMDDQGKPYRLDKVFDTNRRTVRITDHCGIGSLLKATYQRELLFHCRDAARPMQSPHRQQWG